MDMSSYQFVNTLAQCYEANAQLQGGAVPGGETQNTVHCTPVHLYTLDRNLFVE